ncbi:unnamed protein product [Trichogramma brassicae]|uniref:Uncharacterized protein n=1 Tax=Trichogramma brassicae TaxID=86971 RepID=A0A6H5IMZ1_9HYME|nr:unnamed protein product [Trichogramma brassicae]
MFPRLLKKNDSKLRFSTSRLLVYTHILCRSRESVLARLRMDRCDSYTFAHSVFLNLCLLAHSASPSTGYCPTSTRKLLDKNKTLPERIKENASNKTTVMTNEYKRKEMKKLLLYELMSMVALNMHRICQKMKMKILKRIKELYLKNYLGQTAVMKKLTCYSRIPTQPYVKKSIWKKGTCICFLKIGLIYHHQEL